MLADHDHDLALTVLITDAATIDPVLFQVRGANVTTKMRAINGRLGVIVANRATLHFFCHRLAQFVAEHESGLIGQPQVARHGEHGFALHLIAEHGNRREVRAQGQLMRCEQRAAGDAEILPSMLKQYFERERHRGRENLAMLQKKITDLLEERRTSN